MADSHGSRLEPCPILFSSHYPNLSRHPPPPFSHMSPTRFPILRTFPG